MATDATQRADLQYQIKTTDNNIRQVANLGKDSLALLYQQTGDPQYRTAFQALNASTSGNEIAGAIQGVMGMAGMGRRPGGAVEGPIPSTAGSKATTGTTATATDSTATSAYSSAGTKYETATYTDAAGRELPAAVTNGTRTPSTVTSSSSDATATIGENGATGFQAGTQIPANSANSGVGLRNDLSTQARIPTSTSDIWGASLDDLKQAFNTGGTTITQGSARASSSGNAQILNVEGSSTGVVQVQYSPASTKSRHGGQYYKFTFTDGSELKIIDPATYRVLGWPENKGNTTFQNQSGKVISFDPITKTWR
jgi:hypothetical protein